MQIGASYTLQFSLIMGCGHEPSPHIDTQVRLEFSTNHGLTWHLVKEVRNMGFNQKQTDTQRERASNYLYTEIWLSLSKIFQKNSPLVSFLRWGIRQTHNAEVK